MRRAGPYSGWHLNPNGDVIGFSLHGDACAEHEWGVQPLKEALGTKERFENGLADRVNTRMPPAFKFETYTLPNGTPAAWLLLGDSAAKRWLERDPDMAWIQKEAFFRDTPYASSDDPDFAAAWGAEGCFVHVRELGNVNRLKAMAKAVEAHDLAFGGSLVDDRRVGGLTLVRASKVSPELAAKALADDQVGVRLRAAAAKVQPALEATLKRAGKSWMALSPRWNADQTEVRFWLNPMDQQTNQAGLYSVTELEAWARNEGPVLERRKAPLLTPTPKRRRHSN